MHYIVHGEDVRRKTNVVLTRTNYNIIDLTEIFGSFALVTITSVEDRRRYDHLCRWVGLLFSGWYLIQISFDELQEALAVARPCSSSPWLLMVSPGVSKNILPVSPPQVSTHPLSWTLFSASFCRCQHCQHPEGEDWWPASWRCLHQRNRRWEVEREREREYFYLSCRLHGANMEEHGGGRQDSGERPQIE